MARFSVGITGHRQLPAEAAKGFDEAVTSILRKVEQIVTARSEACSLNMVSSLAEGSDQIGAVAALRLDWELLVPLPFPAAEYRNDPEAFSGDARKKFDELRTHSNAKVIEMDYDVRLPTEGGRLGAWNVAAFETAGRVTLAHSDLIVAIWDGQRERGPGGTGQIVREAEELGIPVIWIGVDDPSRVGLLRRNAYRQPLSEWIVDLNDGDATAAEPKLASIVAGILDWPKLHKHDVHSAATGNRNHADNDTADLCREFRTECTVTDPQRRAGLFESLYATCYRWLAPPPRSAAPSPPPLAAPIREIWDNLHPQFQIADALALKYAGLYRSSFLLNYILGGLSVTVALLGALLPPDSAWILGIIELVFLVAMIFNWRYSERHRWHAKFTDYRLLAEHLRHLQFLLPFGLAPVSRPAAHDPENPRQHWANWHLRNVARDAGFVSMAHSAPGFRTQMLDLLLNHWAGDQLDYQSSVHHRTEVAERRLLRAAYVAVWCTIIACAVHLAPELLERFKDKWPPVGGLLKYVPHGLPAWMVLFTAGLPAWANVFHAIAQRAEYVRLNKRSGAMVAVLGDIVKRLNTLKELDQSGQLRAWQLAAIAQETATAMLQEVFDWRIQYRMGQFHPG